MKYFKAEISMLVLQIFLSFFSGLFFLHWYDDSSVSLCILSLSDLPLVLGFFVLLVSYNSSILLPRMFAIRILKLVKLGFLHKFDLVDFLGLNLLVFNTGLAAQIGISLQDIEFFNRIED